VGAWYLPKVTVGLTKFPVPVIGMLSGNSISAIVVSIDYVLKEFVCVFRTIVIAAPRTGY